MAFPVKDDGTLGEGKVFVDVTVGREGKEGAARRHEGGRERATSSPPGRAAC